jgi:DDE superfamily endonuclease
LSFYRPTGRLDPAPADLAYGSLELAALEYQARRGEIILLYEDETVLWRFALPRAGWWRKAQRARLPIRPLSQSQIKREESLKRQVWLQYRSWSRITSGVLLSVIGAVQYGTSKVFYKIVPHFDAQELRQYLHQVMATFSKTGQDVVMVVDRSGIHRAHKLDTTLAHYQDKLHFHFLPAHCGHHLNPIEVCQTQPIKMTWCPLRLFRQTTRSLRGGCKRENEMDVHRFSRHDDLADQTLGNGLTFFKRELGKILAQQLAKGRGIVHDVLPMDALLPCVS